MSTTWRAGVDIGGTFTDVVLTDGSRVLVTAKHLTTPADPVLGVLAGLSDATARAGIGLADLSRIVHATTLATNLVLERAGATVAAVATAGFGDLLIIGDDRRTHEQRYDLRYTKPAPLVPRRRTVEVGGRIGPGGEVLADLDDAQVAATLADLFDREPGVEALAVCLLHSYANPTHERRVAEIALDLRPDLHVACSSSIWPEFREYPRATTTAVSAYVGPVVAGYLGRLDTALADAGFTGALQVMQSNGGVQSSAATAARPVGIVESGPAAGVIAAAHVGRQAGVLDVISFDMGGTTAKAGLVRGGEPRVTSDFRVGGDTSGGPRAAGGHPIKVPVIDLAEVGAGGGSIARVDDGGALRVGPRSAGADPGPACYGRGGVEPTVTDANLVLGYLDPASFASGTLRLDRAAAEVAIRTKIAEPLGLDVVAAAAGIHAIANAAMAAAIRVVTVERGIDPAAFRLVASGGAGPAHVVALAREFGIDEVIVPRDPGVASAAGLLVSDLAVDHVRTRIVARADLDAAEAEAVLAGLEAQGRAELGGQGVDPAALRHRREVDVRFLHQAHELTIGLGAGPLTDADLDAAAEEFVRAWQEQYGMALSDPTQFVNFRVRSSLPSEPVEVPLADAEPVAARARPVWFPSTAAPVDTPVFARRAMGPGTVVPGPAVVEDGGSSTVLPPGSSASVDSYGNLRIHTGGEQTGP